MKIKNEICAKYTGQPPSFFFSAEQAGRASVYRQFGRFVPEPPGKSSFAFPALANRGIFCYIDRDARKLKETRGLFYVKYL